MPFSQAVSAPESPDDPQREFTLRTLGTFGLFSDRAELLLAPGKPLALLAYLVALPGRTAARDHLLHMFWSDIDETLARHTLRQTTYFLRQRLGDHALRAEAGTVELRAPIRCDRAAFLEAVGAGELQQAVEAFGGEYLAGFVVPGALEFEHWADAERQRMRLLFLRSAESLACDHLQCGRFRHARELAERMLQTESLDETAWRLKINAALAGGDFVHALVDARELEALFTAEHRSPEPATRSVLKRARQEANSNNRPETRSFAAELVGREKEFGALVSAFRQACRGTARSMDIVAPAGLGKTRLLSDFARYLGADGKAVAYARALPADRDLPWSYAVEVVRRVAALPGAGGAAPASAATLVALDPALSNVWSGVVASHVADEERFRHRASAIAELIHAVSDAQPFALLLDDLHWADPVSRDLLARVAARLTDIPVLFVGAYRPNTVPSSTDPRDTLSLKPLSVEETRALVTSLGTPPSTVWIQDLGERLLTAADGSPFLTLETLRYALDTGCLTLEQGRWDTGHSTNLVNLLESGSALARRITTLGEAHHRLLLLLAIAGTSVSTQTLQKADGGDPTECVARLHSLEHAGLVVRVDTDWATAHDEIAERCTASATVDECADAHAALATAIIAEGAGAMDLRQAVRHLSAAGREKNVIEMAARWVRSARTSGDRRSAPLLVGDLLGVAPEDPRARSLAAALPWSVRLRRRSLVSMGATVIAIAAAVVSMTVPRVAADDSGVVVTTWKSEPDGSWRMYTHDVVLKDVVGGVIAVGAFQPTEVGAGDRPAGIARPGALGTVATTRTFRDSGGEDVVLLRAGKVPLTRVTFHKGDDVAGGWSPDGRKLAIQTDRWSQRSMSDIAIIDPDHPNASPVRLTHEVSARDVRPVWSPDGSRIALFRVNYGGSGQRGRGICIVSVDGRETSCVKVPQHVPIDFLGWASPLEIAGVFSGSDGISRILIVNVESGAHREIAEGPGTDMQSYASGWIACFCRRSRAEPYQTLLIPINRPEQALRVEPSDPPFPLTIQSPKHQRPYLERVSIRGADRPLPLDEDFQLHLLGWDTESNPVEPRAVRWQSRDTSVAVVQRNGIVHPHRIGRVTIAATAGGWRGDTALIVVGASTTRNVVEEDWRAGIAGRWMSFGEPHPFVAQTTRGAALAPNGDSSFMSGVYLRRALPTAEGVGVEFDVSTPITTYSWQYLDVGLVAADSLDLTKWDHRTGGVPLLERWWRRCGILYPNGQAREQLALAGGIERVLDAPTGMSTGTWTRIRIQVLPDRRCGLAINGRVSAILDRPVPFGDSALLVIQAYSHRTRLLVGPLTAWLGVRPDVNWAARERAEPAPRRHD